MDKERFLWLVTRMLSGEIRDEEQQELEALMKADPQLRKESGALQSFWKDSERHAQNDETKAAFEKLKSQMHTIDPQLWQEEDQEPTRIKWWTLLARTAAAIFFLVGAWYIMQTTGVLPWKEDGLRSESNTRGTRSHIKLADGTSVWLNADSELKYPSRFKGDKREVYLKGEAFFDVAKDASRPFIVHTATMNINVLGTSFNVKAYPNDSVSEATLISGEVEVEMKNRSDKKIRLKPAEKLVLPNGKDSLQGYQALAVPIISTPTYFSKEDSAIIETAWIDNKLIFHDESFTSLATRLERWYNVSICFENTTIQQLRFTGIFKNETVKQALEALQLTEQFNYRMVDDTTIIIY
ncbi:FecR domain-containing protein [Chitinophaga sp. MM2321]|uniref:FecR domain-containing protein n=1 Tax=Chitinophaga sp. MM2321 TaxID=3137178 RepID=UPI0032D58DB3